jgi:hypothetical protein
MGDPVSLIVMAVVKGTAGAIGRHVANDGYAYLRQWLMARYGPPAADSIMRVEQDPSSEQAQRDLERVLRGAGAGADVELARLAQHLLGIIDGQRQPGPGAERALRAGASMPWAGCSRHTWSGSRRCAHTTRWTTSTC